MNSSDFNIWTGSILFAAFVHGLLFMQWGAQWGVNQSRLDTHSLSTRLNFRMTEPYMPEKKPVLKKKPVVKNPEIKKPRKIIPEERAKAVAVEPVVETEIEPQPQMLVPPSNAAWLAQQREQYLQHLMSHIEQFKFYPGAARRRGIEGEVTVSFRLGQDGDIGELAISSDYGILKKAATEAIKSALPLPLPPDGVSFSRQFTFRMLYALK
ncbi:MAG: energy transducer TonB [Gammaproteobacteria bacterium]|nr:energy transducer TonB [Gammaproteobacteria bacterium]